MDGLAAIFGRLYGFVDVTIVTVALPTMVRDFNESFNNVQWVLNAYSLVLGAPQLFLRLVICNKDICVVVNFLLPQLLTALPLY